MAIFQNGQQRCWERSSKTQLAGLIGKREHWKPALHKSAFLLGHSETSILTIRLRMEIWTFLSAGIGNSSACWWSKPVLVGHSASSEDTFSKLGIQNVLICGFHYFPSVQDQVFVREWTIAWGEMVVEDEYPFSHTSVHIWYMRWCLHSFPFTVQTASY